MSYSKATAELLIGEKMQNQTVKPQIHQQKSQKCFCLQSKQSTHGAQSSFHMRASSIPSAEHRPFKPCLVIFEGSLSVSEEHGLCITLEDTGTFVN